MSISSRKIKVFFGFLVLLFSSQLIFFYLVAMNTGLPGRRGGPQDAFRHTYASAVVSKYLSPKIVELATVFSEADSSSIHDSMDIHNNMIGVNMGLSSKNIYRDVKKAVGAGMINSEAEDQITWLPADRWTNGF